MRIALLALSMLGGTGCVIDELREDDVGDSPFCLGAQRWPYELADREDALLDLLNAVRAVGGSCDGTQQQPTFALEFAPELRCAARLHATYVARTEQLTHEGQDGTSAVERVGLAGYPGIAEHELLAADFVDAEAVLQAWLDVPQHCVALFDRSIEHVGIGVSRNADESSTGWVLVTGRNRP